MTSYWDAEVADLFTTSEPVARKTHRCDECRRDINPGERYYYAKGVFDGYWFVDKTCEHCQIVQHLLSKWAGGEWPPSRRLFDLMDDSVDHFDETDRAKVYAEWLLWAGRDNQWSYINGTMISLERVRAMSALAITDPKEPTDG